MPAGFSCNSSMSPQHQWTPLTSSSSSALILRAKLRALSPLLNRNGFIWVSWPKKAAKLPTDITEDVIRNAALPMHFVDVKVCSVDDIWSGLKLVIRKEHR
jgi:hypothetical protein